MKTAEPAEPRGWLFALLGLLIVAGVYAPTLGAPFLWDDLQLIADSSGVRSLDVSAAFLQPFWLGAVGSDATAIYYRPLTTLSYQLDFQLHGANPAGYHLTNVSCHLLASALLFGLLRRRGTSVALSFLLMLLWALFPRLTEGVAWISGRTDVLCTVFVLLALYVHSLGHFSRLVAASTLGLAALLCKEAGVASLVALGLLELGAAGRSTAASRWRGLAVVAPLLVYAALRVAAGAVSTGDGLSLSLGGRLLTALEALGRYALMVLDPYQPRSLMGHPFAPSWPFVVGGAALLGLVGVAWWKRERPRSETVAYSLLVALPLLMVLHLVALPISVVTADRYLYLPLAGLLLTAAPALSTFATQRSLASLALVALVVACGARTASRVADYGDTTRFWLVAAEHAPSHVEPLNALGSIAYEAGLWDESVALYSRALPLAGDGVSVALDNAALVAMMQGNRGLAAELAEGLVRRKPAASSVLRRATIAFNALKLDESERYARRSLELQPRLERAQELLDLIGQARAVASSLDTGPGSATPRLLRDIGALRYPEVVATLRSNGAALPAAAIRQALGFVVAKGRPEDAHELLKRFGAVLPPDDLERLTAGVALRVQTAQETRPRLRAFLAESR